MKITNAAIIILGASGDLAKKKLFPSLTTLARQGHLNLETCAVIGNGRTALSRKEFAQRCGAQAGQAEAYTYYRGLDGLWDYTCEVEKTICGGFDHYIAFFSLPASAYVSRCAKLIEDGFPLERTRVVIEKPFGYNSATARQLNHELLQHFPADQIYLIDHYLGKETLQNIMAIRFANQLLQPVWHRDHIEAIEINGFETIGVEGRGNIYEKMGAIRDVMQNHLLQLLALVAMEPPKSLEANDIRAAKHELLKAVRCVRAHRFQYEGYRQIENVAPDSQVETYAELELAIDNPRWQGIRVCIRGGKMLTRAGVEVILHLKKPSKDSLYPCDEHAHSGESLVIHVQPQPGLELWQRAKIPGLLEDKHFPLKAYSLHYDASYRQDSKHNGVDAYTQLFYSVLSGDKSLFVHVDEAVTAWEVVESALDCGEVTLYAQNTMPQVATTA